MSQLLEITKDHHVYAFVHDMKPSHRCHSEAVVRFQTEDAFGGQIQSPEDAVSDVNFDSINPATGPLHVEGAECGDTLRVEILQIHPAPTGVICSVPGLGLLGDQVTTSTSHIVTIDAHGIQFDDQIRLPIQPMIGVIGIAPVAGRIPTGVPGPHGGNMDTQPLGIGSVLFLPVFQPGAQLAMGDVHALMGDGEICGTGVECAADVWVRVSVQKQQRLEWPWLDTRTHRMVITSAPTLEEAAKIAGEQMIQQLMKRSQLTWDAAYRLISCVGQLQISQVVDPLMTVRISLPREFF